MISSGRRQPLLVGTALCVVPALAAALLLVVGLSTADLTLVYVSIAVSVVVLPAFVYGVVLVVRALASGQTSVHASGPSQD
jgi:hypothetical protein